VKPLNANAAEAGYQALVQRGLYPINHTVVVKNELLDSNPDLAPDLFNAFADARRIYIDRLKSGGVDGADPLHLRVMTLTGDPLPYGIEANRRTLEAIVQYSVEQGILSRPFALEQLFPANTLGLRT
jgi:4,5-dihydroxyphthalate decarboxylase